MGGFNKRRPASLERHVGIEIEFYLCPPGQFTYEESERRIQKVWRLIDLAHLRTFVEIEREDAEWELSILDTQSHYPQTLRKVMSILRYNHAYYPDYCGLHVHLDARGPAGLMAEGMYDRVRAHDNTIIDMTTPARQRSKGYGNPYSLYRAGYETLEVRYMDANDDFPRTKRYIDTLIQYAYA